MTGSTCSTNWSGACVADRLRAERIMTEQIAARQIFASRREHFESSPQPMRDHLGDPFRTALSEPVEQAPECAVRGDRTSRVVEYAVIDKPQCKVEESATRRVIAPLGDRP